MSQNITIAGASYSAVPAITCPKTGGGTARFTDVSDTTAAASDVASGKYFYNTAGTRTQGTASGGGGSVSVDTKTATVPSSTYPTSLSFSSMKGEPKMFAVRLTANLSSSGSTTYYYIVDVIHAGDTTSGNSFRIGSTRRVQNVTSGLSYTYSNSTLTISSSSTDRTALPGTFYPGNYELTYVY